MIFTVLAHVYNAKYFVGNIVKLKFFIVSLLGFSVYFVSYLFGTGIVDRIILHHLLTGCHWHLVMLLCDVGCFSENGWICAAVGDRCLGAVAMR